MASCTLVPAQAIEQRLHLVLALLQLLHQLFQALDTGEEVAVLLHELIEVGIAALLLGFQHAVEVAHHVAHALQIFRRHILDRLLNPLEVLLGDLLLEHLQQFLEHLPRLGTHELVVMQVLDAPTRVWWQLIQEGILLGGDVLEHLLQPAAFRVTSTRLAGARLIIRLLPLTLLLLALLTFALLRLAR